MHSVTSDVCIAIANERSTLIPERVDAFAIASRSCGVVLATVGHRRVDIARELVRKLVDRIDNAAPTHDVFGYVPALLDQVISNPDDIDVSIAAFDHNRMTLVSSPGQRCFRLRGDQLSLLTCIAPGIARADHEVSRGDAFLLCSEGVHAVVSEVTIAASLRGLSPKEAAWALVEASRRGTPHSDITAIVIRPEPAQERA